MLVYRYEYLVPRYFMDVPAFYIPMLYTRYEIQQLTIEYDMSTTTLNVTPLYIHLVLPLLLYVSVNAMQPRDTGAQGSSVSDSVSFISESSEKGSGSAPTLEHRGLGFGIRTRARMLVLGGKGWYLNPAATNSASAACARLLCRSCNALSMHATDASRPSRRTCRWTTQPSALWMVFPPVLPS